MPRSASRRVAVCASLVSLPPAAPSVTDTATIPAERTPHDPDSPRELKLEFRGTAREYFRVWAVNLCLTLLTLGFFSAWAKVRKKRYFYSHTVLDGTPFQYLGEPLPILKGRIVAVVLFAVYYLSDNFFTVMLPAVLAAGVILAPWVIVRSAAFNGRYSAWRNMTFRFDGDYRGALATIYWLGLIPLLVLGTAHEWWGNIVAGAAAWGVFGLLFPWWIRRLKHFVVSHTGFGGENGELTVTGRQLFNMYAKSGLIAALGGAVAVALAGVVFSALKNPAYAAFLFALPAYAGYVLAFAYVQAHGSNLAWNHTTLGPVRFHSTLTGRGMAGLYLTNALAILLSLGLLTPWAVMRTLRYRAEHMAIGVDGGLDAFHGSDATAVAAAGAEVGEFFDVDLSL